MSSFFKKALGVFVEFNDESKNEDYSSSISSQLPSDISRDPANHAEAQKFETYFNNLFEKANLPGPDYFEFYKMMETLEVHIPDYKARLAATFASLSIQGLTKEKLVNTANKYKEIIENDRNTFERVLYEKMRSDVGQRKDQVSSLELKIKNNSEEIQRLNKEISDAQNLMGKVKLELTDQENKLNKNKNGYIVACQAVIGKINSDIQKIQSSI